MEANDNTPVRGLATGIECAEVQLIEQVQADLVDAIRRLHVARAAIQDADADVGHAVHLLTMAGTLDRHGVERIAPMVAPVLHAADLLRQHRRHAIEDSLNAADAARHALDVVRGWDQYLAGASE